MILTNLKILAYILFIKTKATCSERAFNSIYFSISAQFNTEWTI